ncbi:HIT family protein [Candidatus Pacearchaeota archaeon]|nr:HIT family protein [Candidatus Pacearchaeota archaeon]
MALTPEQVEELKSQLRKQVQNLPEEQKNAALGQIESMSAESLEIMLHQQQEKMPSRRENPSKTIFRMIVDKDIETITVGENKESIAVLDINPISRGHSLIIPKKVVIEKDKMPLSAFSLAKKLSQQFKLKLKCSSSEIRIEKKFGENVVHVIPVYDKPVSLESPRQKSSQEELNEVARLVKPKEKIIRIRQRVQKEKKIFHFPRRIP